jgi:putative redox protein
MADEEATGSPAAAGKNDRAVTARTGAAGFRTEVSVRGHRFIADEPVSFGGTDEGPTPYDYLAASLASCTAMTVRMYADRRGWPLEDVTVRLSHGRVHEKDCESCATQAVGIPRFERSIELSGPLTDEQRAGLLRVADRCPVKQTLAAGIHVVPVEAPSP